MLKNKLQQDLTASLKAGEKPKVAVLRFLFSQIQNAEINQGKKELNDDQLIKLIQKQVKKLQDSLTMFKKGGRADLVEKTELEIEILSTYLPQQMSDKELEKIIDQVLAENQGETNTGKLIGLSIKNAKGQADGRRIAQIVREKLKPKPAS